MFPDLYILAPLLFFVYVGRGQRAGASSPPPPKKKLKLRDMDMYVKRNFFFLTLAPFNIFKVLATPSSKRLRFFSYSNIHQWISPTNVIQNHYISFPP